jgi:apolipoprotein N-acyltransferase
MHPVYLIGICLISVLLVVIIATFMSLSNKDTANNSKLLTIIIAFSTVTSLFAYGLALFYFSKNPEYLVHFVLAFSMLIMLPGMIISTSISSVTLSNLRDIVANNG